MARQSWLRTMSGWLARYAPVVTGFSSLVVYEAAVTFYDTASFSLALIYLGPIWGAVIASATALALNVFLYWAYDHLKIDWFKAQMLQELADKETKKRLQQHLTWHLTERRTLKERLIGWVRFALLTIPLDPLVLAIYYRESHFDGISRRDWAMLLKATTASCVVWLLIMEPVVTIAKLAWGFLN